MRNRPISPSVRLSPVLALVTAMTLAACGRTPEPPAAPAAGEPAAPAATAPSTAPAASTPASDAALEGELVASTNEPFWQAQVAGPGPSLVLRGLEGERELAVASSQTSGNARTIHAVDDRGAVDLTVTAAACQDSMSGAAFPFTAVLVIDGGTPINGCARPASMPPPGEPQ